MNLLMRGISDLDVIMDGSYPIGICSGLEVQKYGHCGMVVVRGHGDRIDKKRIELRGNRKQ
jgi:hypothetical protein